jgi:hypothetical protein
MVALAVVMFDNLFGFAGSLGTSFVLVAVILGAVVFVSIGNRIARAAQLQGRRTV